MATIIIHVLTTKLISKLAILLDDQEWKSTDRKHKNNIKIHQEYGHVFTRIGCFKGTFYLQFKDVKLKQVPIMHSIYPPRTILGS